MDKALREAVLRISSRLGRDIKSEAELSNAFLNEVVLPFLRQHMGLLADLNLERQIKKGRYDARVGSLLFEFERPLGGVKKGVE